MDTLDDLIKQVTQAAGPPSPAVPDFVGPVQPTLQDLVSETVKLAVDTSAAAKEQAFKARQERMKQPIIAPPGGTAAAAARGALAGLVKGVSSPVSRFLPDWLNEKLDLAEEDSVRKQLGLLSRDQASYAASPLTPTMLAHAPTALTELGGSFIPFIPGYGAARSLFKVEKAVDFASKAARATLAASATGGIFAAGAKLEPGESRWAKVAEDAAAMGAWEIVGLPLMRKAVSEETPGLVKAVAKELGLTAPKGTAKGMAVEMAEASKLNELEGNVAAVRAGIPTDPKVAEAVLAVAKKDPAVAASPVAVQAAKVSEAARKLSPQTTIDPLLAGEDPNFVARAIFDVQGQKFPVDFKRDPKNPGALKEDVDKARVTIAQLSQNGANPTFEHLYGSNQDDIDFILNSFQGKSSPKRNPDPKKRKVPGAAPPNSIAENGKMPKAGDVVTVKEPNKPPVKATVVEPSTTSPSVTEAGPASAALAQKLRAKMTPARLAALSDDELQQLTTLAPEAGGTPEKVAAAKAEIEKRAGKVAASPTEAPRALGYKVIAEEPAKPVGRTLTKAEAKADAAAKRAEASVVVKTEDGQQRPVSLADLQVPLEVKAANKLTVEKLEPHLDGSPRHGIIHLEDNDVSFEPIGASSSPDQNYFRSEIWDNRDPTSQYGLDPRLTIRKDGVDISVTPLEPLPETERAISRRGFLGKMIEKGQEAAERTKKTAATEDIIGQAHEWPWPGKMSAEEKAEFELDEATFEEIARAIPKQLRKHPLVKEYFEESGGFLHEHREGEGGISRKSVLTDLKLYLENIEEGDPKLLKTVSKLVSQELEKAGTGARVELVSGRRAARVLLSKGVDPDTPVKLTVGKFGGEEYTLRELADVQLHLPDMQSVLDAAHDRGLTVQFMGHDTTVRSSGGFSKTFSHQLEAYESLLRIPKAENGAKIEGPLELQWRMGSDRAYDPDVDVSRFLPVNQQEQGVSEVLTGIRPLAPVYTTDVSSLANTVTLMEQRSGLKPGTIKTQLIPAMNQGKRFAAVIYNEDAVALQAAKHRDVLTYLGVSKRDVPGVIQQLSTKGQGHGIYVLAGRDTSSAALYAHYRDGGSRELWEKGRIEFDSLGPHRRFSKEQKAVVNYPGAGDEAYFPGDLSDTFAPPAVKLTDTPSRPATFEAPDPEFYDTSGPMTKITNWFRPTQEVFKDLQTRTGVPFYNWYRGIEDGRVRVGKLADQPLINISKLSKALTSEERQQVQVLMEARYSSFAKTAEYEKQLSERVKKAATELGKLYEDFAVKAGFKELDVKEFFEKAQVFRKFDGNYRNAQKGLQGIPSLMKFLDRELKTGAIDLSTRELDMQRLANRIIRGIAQEKELMPTWEKVTKEFMAYAENRRIPDIYAQQFITYTQEVLHMPDDLQKALGMSIRQILGKINSKWKLTEEEALDSVSMFSQMNYFSNLAWRPGLIMRNFLQTLQTSYPFLGGRDTMYGWRMGMKWFRSPELQEEMVRRGIVQRGFQPIREIEKLIEGGTSTTKKALQFMYEKGTVGYNRADDFNRVVAYFGQYQHAERAARLYTKGQINWAQFLEKSGADMRDAVGGPFIQELKQMFDAGKVGGPDGALHRLADEFQRATQFVYTRGNAPYVMQSTKGRFFLQYGTWPAWYAETLRTMLFRGSYANRGKALARWVGMQSSMALTASTLFGADASRWVFLSPLGYTGGPFAQLVVQGAEAMQGVVQEDQDPIAKIARKRFVSNLAKQVTPLPHGAMREALQTINAITNGDPQAVMRTMLGMPEARR